MKQKWVLAFGLVAFAGIQAGGKYDVSNLSQDTIEAGFYEFLESRGAESGTIKNIFSPVSSNYRIPSDLLQDWKDACTFLKRDCISRLIDRKIQVETIEKELGKIANPMEKILTRAALVRLAKEVKLKPKVIESYERGQDYDGLANNVEVIASKDEAEGIQVYNCLIEVGLKNVRSMCQKVFENKNNSSSDIFNGVIEELEIK